MSSRWDSLKPNSHSNRSNEGKGTDRSKAARTSRSRQRDNNGLFESRNSRNGRCKPPARQSTSSWRHTSNNNINAVQTTSARPTSSNETSSEFDDQVQNLWNWRETSDSITSKEKQGKESSLDIILQRLSTSLSSANTNTTGSQRGSALAAAFHALQQCTQNNNIVHWKQLLDWAACHLLDHHAPPGPVFHCRDELRMTVSQAQQCVKGMLSVQQNIRHDHQSIQSVFYQCCCLLIIRVAPQLPAEDTAKHMVGEVLVPTLQDILSDPLQEGDMNERSLLLGTRALQALLCEQNHASALLAPLVNDVGVDGQEHFLVNPLRLKVFQVLQHSVKPSFQYSSTAAQEMHQCLTLALQKVKAIDKPSSPSLSVKPTAATVEVLDSLVMERFFHTTINGSDLAGTKESKSKSASHLLVLKILEAYLAVQPMASLALGTILLLKENPKGKDTTKADFICPTCETNTSSCSSILALLHSSNNNDEINLIMASLTIMVSNIPWNLWLGKRALNSRRLQKSPVSNFSVRVLAAIKNLVLTSNCLLVSRWKSRSSSDGLACLVRVVLLKIPFGLCDGASSTGQEARRAGCSLIESLASLLLQKTLRKSPLVESLAEIFADSMGGRLTPQGSRTTMVVPARVWLSSTTSDSFLGTILGKCADAARTNGPNQEEMFAFKIAVKLLRSVLGTRPETVLCREADWTIFKDTVLLLSNASGLALQQSSLQLLEALLQGRKIASHDTSTGGSFPVVNLVLSILPGILKSTSGPSRQLALQIYGALQGLDWLQLLDETLSGSFKSHVVRVLHHCIRSEPSASVRSAACKAVGDICSNCFLEVENKNLGSATGNGDHFAREKKLDQIAGSVCTAMLQSMEDSNAAVRSMAIFAVGNLAQVIGCNNFNAVLDAKTLETACLVVYKCLEDKSEKVSSNAIRSLGHLTVVVLNKKNHTAVTQIDTSWDLMKFCRDVVVALSTKIDSLLTLLPASNVGHLSWKQRSSIKKQGRVACNSLALLMRHELFLEMSTLADGNNPCQKALESLYKIIECVSLLDEKAVIAAMLAFQALPSASLTRVSGKSGLVGKVLVICILFLAREEWSKGVYSSNSFSKLSTQVDLLCEHLIDSAATVDATIVMSCSESEDSWMNQFFEWMVFKNCSARNFGVFALALQSPEIHFSVSVEQKFAIRATNLQRSEDLAEESDDEL